MPVVDVPDHLRCEAVKNSTGERCKMKKQNGEKYCRQHLNVIGKNKMTRLKKRLGYKEYESRAGQFVLLIAEGHSKTVAAWKCGLTPYKIDKWLTAGQEAKERKDTGEDMSKGDTRYLEWYEMYLFALSSAASLVEDALFSKALAGDMGAISKWLDRRMPQEWQTPDMAILDTMRHKLDAYEGMNDDDLRKAIDGKLQETKMLLDGDEEVEAEYEVYES